MLWNWRGLEFNFMENLLTSSSVRRAHKITSEPTNLGAWALRVSFLVWVR